MKPPNSALMSSESEKNTAMSTAGPKLIVVRLMMLKLKKDTKKMTPGPTIAASATIDRPKDDIAGAGTLCGYARPRAGRPLVSGLPGQDFQDFAFDIVGPF